MRKTAIAVAVLTLSLVSLSPASAQSQLNTPSSRAPTESQQLYDASQFRAPVGHRQPRAAEIKPSEPAVIDPIEDMERENAMLARRIGGICRGC